MIKLINKEKRHTERQKERWVSNDCLIWIENFFQGIFIYFLVDFLHVLVLWLELKILFLAVISRRWSVNEIIQGQVICRPLGHNWKTICLILLNRIDCVTLYLKLKSKFILNKLTGINNKITHSKKTRNNILFVIKK